MPMLTPVTVPVPLTVPTPGVLLLHVPPLTDALSAREVPMHTAEPPDNAGVGCTVTVVVVTQPETEYEMTDVPAMMPATMPVADPMVATEPVLLVHVPPEVALLSVVVEPLHKVAVPLIAAGDAFTVTGADTKQEPIA